MRINLSPALGENETYVQGVERANNILELVLGQSSGLVNADWTLTYDERNQPLLTLRLSDFAASVEARFALEEMENPEHLWLRLHRVWGDLLQVRSHKQLQELLGTDGGHGGR